MKLPYKYELTPDVVLHLVNAVNAQQIRGEAMAQSLLLTLKVLRNPLNLKELKEEEAKEQAEKAKVEKK